MARCTALVVSGSEDFGLALVEAQASGRPAVAFASGGALETVRDGETGFLFHEQRWEAVAAAMIRAQENELPPERLRTAAERFDAVVFERRLKAFIEHTAERALRRAPVPQARLTKVS
jgi:glycosyltransferase involved in cell wall biosynthesis